MFEKLGALWNLFRKGEEITNAEAWKKGTISVSALTAFLLAAVKLTKGTSYEIPLDEQAVEVFAESVLGIAATFMHIITSKKAGLLPAKAPIIDHSFPSLDSVSETSEE